MRLTGCYKIQELALLLPHPHLSSPPHPPSEPRSLIAHTQASNNNKEENKRDLNIVFMPSAKGRL